MLFSQPLLRNIRSIGTWGRTVNVRGPVLDLLDPTVPVLECFVLEDAQFPGKAPGKHDCHDETDSDDADDEDKGEVKDNVRSNATDTLGIDETDGDDILQTLAKGALVGPVEVHGKVLAVESPIGAFQRIEYGGILDLCCRQPVQKVQVENSTIEDVRISKAGRGYLDLRLEDGQVPAGVLNVIPGVIDLTFWGHCGQHGL